MPDAIDTLARLFPLCEKLGITIPEDMPLDTEEHLDCAVAYLSRLIWRKRFGIDGPFG